MVCIFFLSLPMKPFDFSLSTRLSSFFFLSLPLKPEFLCFPSTMSDSPWSGRNPLPGEKWRNYNIHFHRQDSSPESNETPESKWNPYGLVWREVCPVWTPTCKKEIFSEVACDVEGASDRGKSKDFSKVYRRRKRLPEIQGLDPNCPIIVDDETTETLKLDSDEFSKSTSPIEWSTGTMKLEWSTELMKPETPKHESPKPASPLYGRLLLHDPKPLSPLYGEIPLFPIGRSFTPPEV